jgi:hypothetical protein
MWKPLQQDLAEKAAAQSGLATARGFQVKLSTRTLKYNLFAD